MKEKTNATAGNISVQIQKLKDAGYIDVIKQYKDNYPETICKITPAGVYTVLHNLSSTADGANPKGSLVQHSNGSFYGMTTDGGTYGGGTIFKITSAGTYSVLKHLNPVTPAAASVSISHWLSATTPPHAIQSIRHRPRAAARFASSAGTLVVPGRQLRGISTSSV